MKKFVCIQCGTCCRNLDKNNIYNDLDKGDGICKYLDELTNLCNIYEARPDKCNVEKGYQYFAGVMSFAEYLNYNTNACIELRGGKR